MIPTSNYQAASAPGGGAGWMPPPPIQPVNDISGGGYKPQPARQPFQPPYQSIGIPTDTGGGNPTYIGPAQSPRFGGQQMPGWAGYIQFLQSMNNPVRQPFMPPMQQTPFNPGAMSPELMMMKFGRGPMIQGY